VQRQVRARSADKIKLKLFIEMQLSAIEMIQCNRYNSQLLNYWNKQTQTQWLTLPSGSWCGCVGCKIVALWDTLTDGNMWSCYSELDQIHLIGTAVYEKDRYYSWVSNLRLIDDNSGRPRGRRFRLGWLGSLPMLVWVFGKELIPFSR